MSQKLQRQKLILMLLWLMSIVWVAKANPVRHSTRLDPFETLAQTLRQQKVLEPPAEPQDYDDYDDYDDYYQNGQLPPRDGPSKARVVWVPPIFQRGQRNLGDMSSPSQEEEDRYYRQLNGEDNERRLLLDTFTDYLWQYARKGQQQSVKRMDHGQKEVSVGSQQKSAQKMPAAVAASMSKIGNDTQTDGHIKNSSPSKMASVVTSDDDLIRELNKLKTDAD